MANIFSVSYKIGNRLIAIINRIFIYTFLFCLGLWIKKEANKSFNNNYSALFFVYDDIDSIYISSLVAMELLKVYNIKPIFISFSNFSKNVDILAQRIISNNHGKKAPIEFIKIGDTAVTKREKKYYLMNVEDFSNKYKDLCIEDIPIGDLIIDSAVREQTHFPSHQISVDEESLVDEVTFFLSTYSKLINNLNPIKAFLVETGYIGLGTLKRILFKRNIPVFNLHPWTGLSKITQINSLWGGELLYSKVQVDTIIVSANIQLQTIQDYCENRFSGKANTPDTKIVYTNQSLSTSNIKGNKLLKVLYLHCFKDLNHFSYIGKTRLFETYLEWTKYTLDKIVTDHLSDWIVKIHPCSFMYGEEKYTIDFIDSILSASDNHVRVISNEISSIEILKNADIVYTFDGTIAVEFACLGKASICLGNRYWDYPFAVTPKTLIEYDKMINFTNTDKLPKLTNENIEEAKKLLYVVSGMAQFSNYIGDAITMPLNGYKELKIQETINAIKLIFSIFTNIFFSRKRILKLSSGVELIKYLESIE